MNEKEIISWLLKGDVSIQYQVYRDLLKEEKPELRKRIQLEGWGAKFLSRQQANGHWGQGYYQPKWTSTHYTVLDLKNLNIHPDIPNVKSIISEILEIKKGLDGGINPAVTIDQSDVCLNGMFLNFASYFGIVEDRLKLIIDFLLSQKMKDGGYNCMSNRSGCKHSSMHSTISVLEGFTEYLNSGHQYRKSEIDQSCKESIEFLLMHKLYKSDRTGKIIKKEFLKLSHPSRWRYNILRALDYFQMAKVPWDKRMIDAINVILEKRNKNGTWNIRAKHAGKTHFDMETSGKQSRWNTLRALRVLKYYKIL